MLSSVDTSNLNLAPSSAPGMAHRNIARNSVFKDIPTPDCWSFTSNFWMKLKWPINCITAEAVSPASKSTLVSACWAWPTAVCSISVTFFFFAVSTTFWPTAIATMTMVKMTRKVSTRNVVLMCASVDLNCRLEYRCSQRDPRRLQPLVKLRADTGRPEPAHPSSVFPDPRLVEDEDVLRRNLVAFHSDAFRQMRNPAAAVAEARDLNEQIHGRSYLLADRPHTHVRVGHANHDFESPDGVARAVGVDGGQRSVVTGVHRL